MIKETRKSNIKLIKDHKRAEELLTLSEAHYRRLFESTKDGILILDAETGKIVDVNPFLIKLLGYPKKEFIKKKLWEIGFFKDIVANKNYFLELQKKKYVRYDDLPLETSNGKKIYVEFVSSLYQVNDEKVIQCNIRDITKRRQLEKELRKSEIKLRQLFENTPIAYHELDISGRIININRAETEMLGYSREEMIGQFVWKFSGDEKAARKRVLDKLKGLVPPTINEERIYTRKDKTTIPILVGEKLLRDQENNIIGILTTIQDITKLKSAETEIRKLSRVVEQSPASIIITNPKGNIEYVNESFCKTTGYSRNDVLGKSSSILRSDRQDSGTYKELWDTILSGNNWKGELLNRKKNGDLFWESQLISPLVNNEGEITNFIAIKEDITEQKKTKSELLLSEDRYNGIFNNSLELIYIFDLEGHILEANAHALNLFGYSLAEVKSMTIFDLLNPSDWETVQKNIWYTIETGVNEGLQVYKIQTNKGRDTFIETTAIRLDRDGEPYGILGIARDITNRVISEQALRNSEERLSLVFNNTSDMQTLLEVEHDNKLRIVTVNQSFIKSFRHLLANNSINFNNIEGKYRDEALIALGFSREHFEKENQYFQNAISNHTPVQYEQMVPFEEKTIYLECTIVPVTDNKGRCTHLLYSARDVSRHREMEADLAVATEIAKLGYWEYDVDSGNFIFNDQYYKIIHGSSTEKQGGIIMSAEEFAHRLVYPDDANMVGIALQDAINSKDPNYLGKKETRLYRENGDITIVSVQFKVLKDSTGRTYKVYGINQDITERKLAEKEVTMLAHSLENVNECVSITDTEDKIIFINESFLKTYGYERNELIGKHISLLRSLNNPIELINEILPKTLNGGWKGEVWNKRKDGTEFLIHLSTTIINDKDKKPIGLIGIAVDITERKRIESELIHAKENAEEMNKLKSNFLANMSHELRTPLIGILGYAEILENEIEDTELIEMINTIKTSGQRLNTTLNNILNISKIESKQLNVNLKEHDLIKYLKEQMRLFKVVAEIKKLSINFESHEKILNAYIDVDMFVSIINNLLSNAIKYTERGGLILNAIRTENYAVIKVIDSGIGVPEDLQKIIFEPFRQVSEGYSRRFEGSGLGLTLVKKYTELMGGTIIIKSKPSRGSTFILKFPIHKNITEDLVRA